MQTAKTIEEEEKKKVVKKDENNEDGWGRRKMKVVKKDEKIENNRSIVGWRENPKEIKKEKRNEWKRVWNEKKERKALWKERMNEIVLKKMKQGHKENLIKKKEIILNKEKKIC